jgi:hypothetical protein
MAEKGSLEHGFSLKVCDIRGHVGPGHKTLSLSKSSTRRNIYAGFVEEKGATDRHR